MNQHEQKLLTKLNFSGQRVLQIVGDNEYRAAKGLEQRGLVKMKWNSRAQRGEITRL